MLKGEWESAKEFVDKQTSWPVGAKCPNCRKGKLERGPKKHDVVQVYCSICGFMTDRKCRE
jgi:Zn ribbon nucleic-acid-binding protein